MSFLTPLAFAGAALAIPVVLLYMLRLRRREVTISSTFLWQQILRDREANTPWQKLKRNLLLFLQLLILALLVLALARPFIIVPAISAGQIALLIDASASMNATDAGESRFEEAKDRALDIVDTMSAQDSMTVIRVADVPEVLSPYTSDQAELRTAINNMQPSVASSDWSAALTLAAAGAVGSEDFNIVLISDGGLGEAATLPAIPGEVELVTVGESDSNLAITALATRILAGDEPQIFAQITNYGAEDAEIIFDLRADGQIVQAERYTVPASSDLPIVADALGEPFSTLQAGLTVAAESAYNDYLLTDNSAWAVASDAGNTRILLMTQGNLFLEQVLRSLPGIEAFSRDTELGLPSEPFDLYIFDGWLPDALPAGDLFIIDPPETTSLFTVGEQIEEPGPAQVRREDPRMVFVDFDTVSVREFTDVNPLGDWAEPLITTEEGTLVYAGEVGGRQVAVITFNLFDSDLPLQIAFPVLISNFLSWFTPQDIVSVGDGLRVGESLLVRPPLTAESLRVTLPDGSQTRLSTDRAQVVFADTAQPGIYTLDVLEGGEVTQSIPFAVNLFDELESNITPVSTITLGETTVEESAEEEIGQREFWFWLALLALAILLIEWYAYHRRLRAPTIARPVTRRPAGSVR